MDGRDREHDVFPAAVSRRFLARRIAVLAALTFVTPAWADGDEFFGFQSKSFNPDGTPIPPKTGYFGSVKDDHGNYLQDATVTLAITVAADDGPRRVTFNSYTNVLGRYHTLDFAAVAFDLLGIDAPIDPANVTLLDAKKAGYAQVRRFNRSKAGLPGPREVDFVMTKRN